MFFKRFLDPASAAIGGASAATQVGGFLEGKKATRQGKREAKKQATEQIRLIQEQNKRLLSAQEASFGAANLSSTGTPGEVGKQTIEDAVLDERRVLNGLKAQRKRFDAADKQLLFGLIGGLSRTASQVDFSGGSAPPKSGFITTVGGIIEPRKD